MKGGFGHFDRQKIKNLRRTLSSLRSERVTRARAHVRARPDQTRPPGLTRRQPGCSLGDMNAALDLAAAVRFAYQTDKPLTEHARFTLIALAFLEFIEDDDAVTYDKLVKTTGLSLATIYRAVNSLRDREFVLNKRRSILTINKSIL